MKVKIFKKNFCPYCTQVRELLDEKKVVFDETDITEDEELFKKLKAATLQQTIPYVFIDDRFIGGHEELKRYFLMKEILS